MARRPHLPGRALHEARAAKRAVDESTAAGGISADEGRTLEAAMLRSLTGMPITPVDARLLAKLVAGMTGRYPPVGELVSGNNRAFRPPELHSLYRLDTTGQQRRISPRRWLSQLTDDDATGLNPRRAEYVEALDRVLTAFIGPDYKAFIKSTISTRRVYEVLASDLPVPDFERPRPGWTRPRDPVLMMSRALDLGGVERAHFLAGVNKRIGTAIGDLIDQVGPRELAKRVAAPRGSYRIRISRAYIWHTKGWIFETLIEAEQLAKLFEVRARVGRAAARGTVLLRGVKVRRRLPDGTLGPAVSFSDGVVATLRVNRRGRPSLEFHDIHEAKSGDLGDVLALEQTDKWSGNLSEIGEVVFTEQTIVTRVRAFDRVQTTDFPTFLRRITHQAAERRLRRAVRKKEGGPVIRTEWAFVANLEFAPASVRRRRPPVAMVEAPSDAIFLANSSRFRAPDVAEIREFYPYLVKDPVIVSRLVAEEIEYLAVRLLEEVAGHIYARGTLKPDDYWELTPQRLKELGP